MNTTSTFPEFITPSGPDYSMIAAIHRGNDGLVSFHRRDPRICGAWANLFSIPAAELEQFFPSIVQHIQQEGYFSINAMYRNPKYGRSKVDPGLPIAKRGGRYLRWLTAVFCDLDVEHPPIRMTSGEAIGRLIDLQDSGQIPPISLIGRSGRGVWPFWILRGECGDFQDAKPPSVQLHERVQRAIADRLTVCAPDSGCDPSRCFRVPGSINSLVNVRADYWLHLDPDTGRGYTYTLAQLAKFLGVRQWYLPGAARKAEGKNPVKAAAGSKGHRVRWEARLNDLQMLRAVRKGFQQGTRNRAALLYASILNRLKHTDEDIEECVYEVGRECDPPLSDADIQAAVKQGKKGLEHPISDATIAAWLHIAPEEASRLDVLPYEGKLADLPPLKRGERIAKRRELIDRLIRQTGALPTIEQIRCSYEQSYHMRPPSVGTVAGDLKALGWSRRLPTPQTPLLTESPDNPK